MKRIKQIALLVMVALCAFACGKKADPGLPMPVVPEAPKRIRAAARAEGIFILWRAPDKNVNDTDLLDLAGFKLLRASEPIEKFCPRCPKNMALLADIDYKGDRGAVPEKKQYYYQDTALEYGTVYFYQLRAYNEREKNGKLTDFLTVYWDRPSAAPEGLQVDRDNKLLMLSWQPVTTLEDASPLEDFAGYNIYRSTRQGIYDEAPINQEPVQEPAFEDVPEEIDTTYYYTVRSARRVKETIVESAASDELQVDYMDVTAPGTPRGLTAIPRENGIELKWVGSMQKDVAGYNVYRRQKEGFVRINDGLVTQNSYVDTGVRRGGRYAYAVTSVDASPAANESAPSETATVTYQLK